MDETNCMRNNDLKANQSMFLKISMFRIQKMKFKKKCVVRLHVISTIGNYYEILLVYKTTNTRNKKVH